METRAGQDPAGARRDPQAAPAASDPRARLASWAAVAAGLALIAFAFFFRTADRHDVRGPDFTRWEGRAASVTLPPPFPGLVSRSDRPSGTGSRLKILEDGAPLPLPHALHADIAAEGRGRYSHWGSDRPRRDVVIFSASDGSDPLSNGRTYTFIRPLSVDPVGKAIAGLLGAAAFGFGLCRGGGVLRRDLRAAGVWGRRALAAAMARLRRPPPERPAREARPVAYAGIAAALAILAAAFGWRAGERLTLEPGDMTQWSGLAASVYLPAAPFGAQSRSDHPSGKGSRLVLHEDGAPLALPHATHMDIAENGRGRYSHWRAGRRDYLIFSASDASDPATNGRRYEAVRPLYASPGVRLVAGLVAAAIAALSLRGRMSPLRADLGRIVSIVGAGRLRGLARASIGAPDAPALSLTASLIGLALAALAGLLGYSLAVAAGGFAGTSIGAVFQVSDAMNYWVCANQIIDDGAASSWCHRRPLYSMFLAGLTMPLGRNLVLTLAAQTAFIAAAAFLFARELARFLGWIAAAAAVAIVWSYLREFALGQTASEVLGLSLGLLAAAALLRAGERGGAWLAAVGVFLFALAQVVRPGALFALPLVVLWAALLGGWTLRGLFARGAAAALAAALPFALHSFAVAALGGDAGASNANFAQTFYGLTVGRDWSSLVADHPELGAETRENISRIYAISIENIRADAATFVNSLLYNANLYLHAPWVHAFIPRGPFYLAIAGLLAVGALSLRSPRAGLVFAVAAGELLSAFILARDGHPRVWAASGPLTQAIPPALLLAGLLRAGVFFSAPGRAAFGPARPDSTASRRLILAPAALALLLIALPATPLRGLVADMDAPAGTCPAGADRVVLDLGASNRMELASGEAGRRLAPPTILRERLRSPERAQPWYLENIAELPDGIYVGSVAIGPGVGDYTGAYAPPGLDLPMRGEAVLCLDPEETHLVALWPFRRIISAEPVR